MSHRRRVLLDEQPMHALSEVEGRLSPHTPRATHMFDRLGMLPYNKEFGPTPNISLHLQR